MRESLGLIETIGLSAAITALDAASKTADIALVGCEKVIGAGQSVSVTLKLEGDVASVQAGVDAGVRAAEQIGTVISHHVIPRPQNDVFRFFCKDIDSEVEEKVNSKECK